MLISMNSVPTRARRVLASVVVAALAAACSSTTTPTVLPNPNSITETFAGTLTKNGATTYSFAIATPLQSTNVTATLTSVTPDDTIILGLSLGTWNGASCQVIITNDKALEGSTVLGTVNTSGTLCVRVFDVGGIADPLSYEIKVIHF